MTVILLRLITLLLITTKLFLIISGKLPRLDTQHLIVGFLFFSFFSLPAKARLSLSAHSIFSKALVVHILTVDFVLWLPIEAK